MRFQLMNNLLGTGFLVPVMTIFSVQPTVAGTLYNGWNYAIDAPKDSLNPNLATPDPNDAILNQGAYELFGLSIKEDWQTNSIIIAINGNLPLTGFSNPYAADGNVGYGDLFFNFYGDNFTNTINTSNLFGIRFSPTNDSGAATTGVYEAVTPKPVSVENHGFYLQGYYGTVAARELIDGDVDESKMFGDLSKDAFSSYMSYQPQPPGQFQPTPNVIRENTGTRLGDVTLLSVAELLAAGLDLNQFSNGGSQPIGSQTIGFRFDRTLFPKGKFTAHLSLECLNDIIAIMGQFTPPPPPPPPLFPELCPTYAEQQNVVLPDRVDRRSYIFENATSGSWFDPAAEMGFTFEMVGDGLFTSLQFPCGIDNLDGAFTVSVNGQILGNSFTADTPVDFINLTGGGVRGFTITGIDAVNLNPPPPFPVKLWFDDDSSNPSPSRNFKMTPLKSEAVPEPNTVIGLLLSGVCGLGLRRFRKK